jgi:hypothetical protein
MKRSMLVGLGALLMTGIMPFPGHAGQIEGVHFQSGRHCFPLQNPDIQEDLQEIRADQQALVEAIQSRNRQEINAARMELRSDIRDLRGDLVCRVVSEDE